MLKEKLQFQKVNQKLKSLIIYKTLVNDSVLVSLYDYIESVVIKEDITKKYLYYDFISKLLEKAEQLELQGNIFTKYIIYLILNDVNVFTILCEQKSSILDSSMYKFALSDINDLIYVMNLPHERLNIEENFGQEIRNYIPVNSGTEDIIYTKIQKAKTPDKILNLLIMYYRDNGSGELARHKMLKYIPNEGLIGIKNYDPITFENIVGYEKQKDILINNTKAFLEGRPANNVLLIGSRGTGKSSSVKALANLFYEEGLRLIEIHKDDIKDFPTLARELAKRGRKFIMYIDDLSYEESEVQYKYLKSILEGSTELKPNNVLFYATSNRRHIVNEKFSDNKQSDDSDIHSSDTVNEKLALSDRFGLTVTFGKPTPEEYFEIVKKLASDSNIIMPEEELRKQAFEWELNQNVRSGRTARQFIDNILSTQYLN